MKIRSFALISWIGMMFAVGMVQGASAAAKIYSLLPNTALTGIVDPSMPDRTSIKKAWPKKPADPQHVKIGWTAYTLGVPWFVEVGKAAQKTANKYGYTLDMQVADGDLQRQCAQIDNFVTRKMDVIVVNPVDTVGASQCINRAVDAGVPVISVGAIPDASARVLTSFLGDAYGNGFLSGRYVAKTAGAGTPITAAILIGVVGNATSESRVNGMISGVVYERDQQLGIKATREDAMLEGFNLFQELKKSGKFDDAKLKFKVVGMGVGNWSEEGGLSAAEDLLSAHANEINFILSENDFMGLGALRALNGVGKAGQIKIAAAGDGFRVALDQVVKGGILVTGENSGEENGVAVVEFIHNAFSGRLDANNLPAGSMFPPRIITKENVAQKLDPDKNNLFFKYEVPEVKSIPQLRSEATQQ